MRVPRMKRGCAAISSDDSPCANHQRRAADHRRLSEPKLPARRSGARAPALAVLVGRPVLAARARRGRSPAQLRVGQLRHPDRRVRSRARAGSAPTRRSSRCSCSRAHRASTPTAPASSPRASRSTPSCACCKSARSDTEASATSEPQPSSAAVDSSSIRPPETRMSRQF